MWQGLIILHKSRILVLKHL